MEWVLTFLFTQIDLLGERVSILTLMLGALLIIAIARRAWPPVGVLALVAIFAYWVPLMPQ